MAVIVTNHSLFQFQLQLIEVFDRELKTLKNLEYKKWHFTSTICFAIKTGHLANYDYITQCMNPYLKLKIDLLFDSIHPNLNYININVWSL